MVILFKKKYSKFIIMSAVILSFIISGTILLKSKNTSSLKQQYTLGNTSGNIINNCLTAYQNGYIYYSNISDRCKLYRMKEDGSDKKKISNDSSSYINADGYTKTMKIR